MTLPHAEDINYWKSGQSSPDTWMEKTTKLIENFGGIVLGDGYISQQERKAFLLEFQIKEDTFKILWPVLPSKGGNQKAARIQAATMIHHDVKARLISAAVLGARTAMLNYLVLPDGRTAGQATTKELASSLPPMLLPPAD